MKSDFTTRLRAGDLLVGTMLTLPAPEISELMAKSGFDWLFLDAEHSPADTLAWQRMMQASGDRCACLVRTALAEEREIKKALDIGADGIIAPQVNTAEQAQQVVAWCKYPPQGVRGVGLGRAQGYGLEFEDYLKHANEQIAVVVQIEHKDAVENADEIVSVPGIDAVLIGPYDLSASMGKIGQVSDPEVVDAIAKVTAVCKKAHVKLGIFGVNPDAVKPYIEAGYNLIVSGVDTLFLLQGANETLKQLQ